MSTTDEYVLLGKIDQLEKELAELKAWRKEASDTIVTLTRERDEEHAALVACDRQLGLFLNGTQHEALQDLCAAANARAASAEARVKALEEALAQAARVEGSNARRMRAGIVEARKHLAKGRALWNGPALQCDTALAHALSAWNDTPSAALEAKSHD